MKYANIVLGSFIDRPNRFTAQIEIDGTVEVCHVKNTSRLRELLIPGAKVSVQYVNSLARKTKYDLIAVYYSGRWVNIDSQAPNKVFGEWLAKSNYFGELSLVKPETTFKHSRFDYYIENGERKTFIEVKGVTLVEEQVARFPGAPTVRGAKHVRELCECIDEGYEAAIAFVVKRDDVVACGPNDALDPVFGETLRKAAKHGVQIIALDCNVTKDSLEIREFVPVILN